MSQWVAQEAFKQGFIGQEGTSVESLTADEANQAVRWGPLLWGGNSRGKAIRAKELLGWKPKERGLQKETADIVKQEAELIGLVKHHAKVAAGSA